MIAASPGKWVKQLSLTPGRYEYRFVVDGDWVSDPNAEQTPNPHGGCNSVLIVQGKIQDGETHQILPNKALPSAAIKLVGTAL